MPAGLVLAPGRGRGRARRGRSGAAWVGPPGARRRCGAGRGRVCLHPAGARRRRSRCLRSFGLGPSCPHHGHQRPLRQLQKGGCGPSAVRTPQPREGAGWEGRPPGAAGPGACSGQARDRRAPVRRGSPGAGPTTDRPPRAPGRPSRVLRQLSVPGCARTECWGCFTPWDPGGLPGGEDCYAEPRRSGRRGEEGRPQSAQDREVRPRGGPRTPNVAHRADALRTGNA